MASLQFKEVAICAKDLSAPRLSKSANQSTEQQLDQISGLSMIRRGNYAFEPAFRGLNSNQLTVTIDGMKIFGACTDKMDPVTSYVAPDNLAKACMDQTGDCNASCNMASLDLRTKKLSLAKTKPSGFVNSGFNSNGFGRVLNGEVKFSNGKSALSGQAFFTKSDNYIAGGGEEILFTQYTKLNASLHYKRKFGDNANLSFKYIADRAYDIGYAALPMDVSFAGGDILALDFKQHIGKEILQGYHVKLYGNRIEHIMDDTKRPDVAMHMDMPGLSQTLGAFGVATLQFGEHSLRIKPEVFRHRAYAEMTMYPTGEAAMFMLTWPDVVRFSKLLSFVHKHKVNHRISSENFLVFEQQSNEVKSELGLKQLQAVGHNIDAPINRLAYQLKTEWSYRINRANQFKLKLAQTQRAPSTSEAFGYYLFNNQDGYDYLGNPMLENEQSTQMEFTYSTGYKSLSVHLNAYQYWINNYIIGQNSELDAMTIGATGVREYVNLPQAVLQGIELNGQYAIHKNLKWLFQASYSLGKDNNNNWLPLISPFRSTNQWSWLVKGYDINLTWNYAADQNRIADYFGETRTAEYHLIDANISHQFKLGKNSLTANAGVVNLFDVSYVDHLDWNKIQRPGRSVNLSLRYSF